MVEEVQEDPTGVRAFWDRGNLSGASQKAYNYYIFVLAFCLHFILFIKNTF